MMAENIEGSAENNILEVEDDSELKRKAMEKYTAFLETLDSNSLKNEVKSPSFEKNTQNFIEKSDAQVEETLNVRFSRYMQGNELLQNKEKLPIHCCPENDVKMEIIENNTTVNEKTRETNVKWQFLEHNGPIFPPLYDPLPENVKFYYKGSALKLSPLTEEFACIYSRTFLNNHPDFKIPEIFNQNFMEGWREIMTEEERKIICNLDECNFTELKEYFLQKKANDKLPPKHGSHLNYDKKAQKKKNVQLMINYGFCMMDGQKHELVKFKIKPPELYRHKAKNPNIGKLRHRIRPEDVIINCSEDSYIPRPPEGHQWKEVRHDNTVTWVACWQDSITSEMIYVNVGSPTKNSLAGVWKNQQVLRAEEENSTLLSATQSVNENHPQDQGIPSSSGVANHYIEMNTNIDPIKLEHDTASDLDLSLGQFEMEMNTNLNAIKLEQQHDTAYLDPSKTNVKWQFLEHNGPIFPPLHDPLPENVKFYYKGNALKLSPLTEEFALIYSKSYCCNHPDFEFSEIFNKNFMEGWRKIMTEEERTIICNLDECNFAELKEYNLQNRSTRLQRSTNDKKAERNENIQLMKNYGFCFMDGQKYNLVKCKIKPPGLYASRRMDNRGNPNIGRLRLRIRPEDVIINCSMDSNIPKPPEGHQWKEVLHDNTVTWVASWHDSMSNEMVYVDVGFPTNDKALDLDQFELVYLNGPPWTNSTKSIVKKERISYQNAAGLTLEFFQADPTSGIYKRIDCIPCQKNMMNIRKNGQLYNVITSHLDEKSHTKYIRKPPKRRKVEKDRKKKKEHEIPAKLAAEIWAAQKRLDTGSLALDLNPSLDEFEVVYLNGPPWPTNSTHDILKKERISYQNASCLPLDFFKADPTSGIYKCINCIPCQKIMMNITKKGQLQNVIVPHFNGKWHGIRCMGAQGFKQPNKRKLNSKGTNENPTSDDEPQIKRRKNKKHKHQDKNQKKEEEYYKNLSSQAKAYAQDQNEKD